MFHGSVLAAQGGGPTAVINQSMVGAVLETRNFRSVELIYGAVHGVRGILDEDFCDLTRCGLVKILRMHIKELKSLQCFGL